MHTRGLLPVDVIDKPQHIDDELVITEEALIAHLLGEAETMGVELLDDVDVVNVVDAHLAYFDAIGAVGPTPRADRAQIIMLRAPVTLRPCSTSPT